MVSGLSGLCGRNVPVPVSGGNNLVIGTVITQHRAMEGDSVRAACR